MAKEQDYKIKLPEPNIRPDSRITQPDALMLDMYILTNMKWIDVWMLFKGQVGTKVTNRDKANQYLGLHDTKIYLEERCKQLKECVSKKPSKKVEQSDDITKDDFKRILRILVDHAKDETDPLHIDALKALVSKATKFLDAEEEQEPPRRYMPETCRTCRYKKFCEQECEDECDKCKYKEYANEHGVVYTPQNQLNK